MVKPKYNTPHEYRYAITMDLLSSGEGGMSSTRYKKEVGILEVDVFPTPHMLSYMAFRKALLWYVENGMINEDISIYTDDYKVGKQICIQYDGRKNQKITRRYDFYDIAKEVEALTRMFKNLKCIQIPQESNAVTEVMITNFRV